MDREGFHAKIEMVNQLIYKKDYKSGLELINSINWKKIKDARALYIAGEVYAANKLYQESKEVFLMAHDRLPVRKNILYRLVEVSIKTGELEDAWEYYQRFLEAAPNDDIHYVLKYKILSAQEASLDEQIQVLEEYKERDYTERWSYELATLYYGAGDEKKCVETCDDIVLWFSEGEYVRKALELKQRLTNLTPRQKDIYETMISQEGQQERTSLPEGENLPEEPEEEEEEAPPAGYVAEEETPYLEGDSTGDSVDDMVSIVENNDSLQEKISKGIKDIFSGIVKEWEGEDDLLESYPGTPKINIADVIPPQQVEESIREKEAFQEEEGAIDKKTGEEEPGTESGIDQGIDGPEKGPEKSQGISGSEESPEKSQSIREPEEGPEEGQGINGPEESPEKNQAIREPEEGPEEGQGINGPEESPEKSQATREPEESPQESQGINGPEEKSEEKAETGQSQDKVAAGSEVRRFDTSKLPKLELPELNLEAVILSAAEKQGIEVPDEEKDKTDIQKEDPAGSPGQEEEEKDEERDQKEENQSIVDKVQPEGEIRPQEEILSEEESLIQFIESKDAQANADQDTIVPRSKTLDDTEVKIFSYFSTIPGMSDQLVEALADAQLAASDKTSRSGNIIVMGNRRTGKTRLINGLIKAICRELHMPAARIAVVEASQLNGKDMPKIVSKLSGGFLAIKKTSQLAADSVFQLNQALEFRTDGLTVILEDEKIGMRKFIAKYQKFAKKFTSTINIPVFTNDELVHFAKIYADEMGYVMDTMGVLALYNLIGDNQKEDEPMTIGTVKDMMDAAITKAESSHRKLQRSISKKRFDDEGKIILYEKDFK